MTDEPTRYCDLVMKGGITSGIVYPNAVLALARDFRFKNIGGTSAGAIAAAATAAAGVGDRRHAASGATGAAPGRLGFTGLRQVAGELASEGFIYGLFQPARGAKNAYRTIVILAGNAGGLRKGFAACVGVVAIAPVETVLLLGLFLAIGAGAAGWHGVLAAALPSILCAYLGAAICALLRVARVARCNMLGLCSGLGRGRKPALTEWLHDVLQALSGKAPDDPLIFDDLWSAPRYPGEPQTDKAIGLQMITTGVSHHEPRTLPFTDAGFWFLREQFDRLFPPAVVDWMVAQACSPVSIDGCDYYKLPSGGRMPVLVAMRMSLSFPMLISAVPLYEPAARGARPPRTSDAKSLGQSMDGLTAGGGGGPASITAFRICWFSDGGISSNFPLHLFDAPLPLWPTFAIDLVYASTDDSDRVAPATPEEAVSLPLGNNEGWKRTYQSIARPRALSEVAGFLFGIVGTMQNWRDLLQSRAPGQRDRIVHVSLDATEGGMNLNMPQAVLDSISLKGSVAGERLYQFSFENHYWLRWRNVAAALQRYTIRIAASDACEPKIAAFAPAYAMAKTGEPAPVSYRFRSQGAQAEAQRLLGQLVTQGAEWEDLGPDLSDGAPRPQPQMQVTPIY